ncbi:MAG TPA: SMI1/KNR4 family protein [Nostocaceae cyanobacterium]|nr:SMI1/KNR4 family protein [Nostocaceae cyanobacterium]
MNNFWQLKQKLEQLANLDATFEIFGAESHGYQSNPCLKDAEIQAFERKYNIDLPRDYRQFLLEVGNGGAGPGYGLYKILGTGSDNEVAATPYQNNFDILSRPFSFTTAWNNLELPVNEYLDNKLLQGALTIANYGCGIYALLVITGDQKGQIWIDDRTNDSGIYPASLNFCRYFHNFDLDEFLPEGDDDQPLGFYDWYDNWLNQSLEQVKQSLVISY